MAGDHQCGRLGPVGVNIDEILESPLEAQPFIQTEQGHSVLPAGYRAQPLHLFHTVRNRKHVLHCYEFLLMRTLEEDSGLWQRLCERFGTCDQCLLEMGSSKPPQHSHIQHKGKDPFSINSIHPDLWFLAITLKESKDKLIHFIRSELPKRKEEAFHLQKPFISTSFLSSYLSSFNFVEMYLDSIFRIGEVSSLPRELFQCCNVKTLSLRNNFLDTLPPDIGRLGKLERLFLTNNKLQNKSIPFTIAFCRNLSELYIDNNLLDALPGTLLLLQSLERVHRHGNHNYFKATFMWYHTDINDRILECCGDQEPPLTSPPNLQKLAATAVIRARINFYQSPIPARIKDFLSYLCEGIELCSNCSRPGYKTSSSFKVFTFKNPYLGNTCVPFQHWACSLQCARAVEIPARREQLSQAEVQDREYERYVRESLSRLRPSQRTLSASSLTVREEGGEVGSQPETISCGIL